MTKCRASGLNHTRTYPNGTTPSTRRKCEVIFGRALSEVDGKILYRLKTKYSDGTTHVLFDPMELVEKVVALIPPPRANLLRYHGVFAPNSKERTQIVPAQEVPREGNEDRQHSENRTWSTLLKRSFAIDVMKCSACGGQMKLISHIEEPKVVTRILNHLGLPTDAPQPFAARAPPQAEFFEWQTIENDSTQQPSFD